MKTLLISCILVVLCGPGWGITTYQMNKEEIQALQDGENICVMTDLGYIGLAAPKNDRLTELSGKLESLEERVKGIEDTLDKMWGMVADFYIDKYGHKRYEEVTGPKGIAITIKYVMTSTIDKEGR